MWRWSSASRPEWLAGVKPTQNPAAARNEKSPNGSSWNTESRSTTAGALMPPAGWGAPGRTAACSGPDRRVVLDAEAGPERHLSQRYSHFSSGGHVAECRFDVVHDPPQLDPAVCVRVHWLVAGDRVAGAVACFELHERLVIALDFEPEDVDEETFGGVNVADVLEAEIRSARKFAVTISLVLLFVIAEGRNDLSTDHATPSWRQPCVGNSEVVVKRGPQAPGPVLRRQTCLLDLEERGSVSSNGRSVSIASNGRAVIGAAVRSACAIRSSRNARGAWRRRTRRRDTSRALCPPTRPARLTRSVSRDSPSR